METIRKMWNDYKVRKIPENNMSLQNQHAMNSFNNNVEGLLIKTWIISEVFYRIVLSGSNDTAEPCCLRTRPRDAPRPTRHDACGEQSATFYCVCFK